MKYPSGFKRNPQSLSSIKNNMYSNRGMNLEEDINVTNKYYLETNRAVIHKKPTPIQIVNVHYPKRSAAVITEGYFQRSSTTDYNGIYNGKYIDFEVKETKNKTLFPLANIHEHQMEHLQAVLNHGAISFLIIRFSVYNETYFLEIDKVLPYWEQKLQNSKMSIPYNYFQKHGYLIPFKYQARVDYLSIVDQLYFPKDRNRVV